MTLLGEIIRVRYRKSIGVNAFVVFLWIIKCVELTGKKLEKE